MDRGRFALKKWYIDCLDDRGRLAILYWASLEWRRLRVTWHSATLCEPGASPRARSSLMPCAVPRRDGDVVRWSSRRLACEAELRTTVSGTGEQHLADRVTWNCLVPAARASVRVGDSSCHGNGYAEVITLRGAPWTLGITHLRWGRWISEDASRSIAWIVWAGPSPLRLLFVDGRAVTPAMIDDRTVTGGNVTLTLGEPATVIDRRLSAVVGRIPGLRTALPRSFLASREHKRTRSGTLRVGTVESHGFAVDEVVDFT